MATDLTGNKIKDTYQQILHVDGGVTSTDKTVYDGDGTATALKVSTTSVDVTALKLAGSAITVTAAQINAGVDAQPAAEAAALAAASSASAAASSASSAATAYDQFDDRYLGSKSSAPTVDNDGNALLVGALYFNSVTTNMNVWNGSAWTATYIPVTGYAPLANPAFTGEVTENGYDIVSQADIGTAPNEIPLNQYLGSLAYQDLDSVTIDGGVATLDTATITSIQNDTAISNVEPSLMLNFAQVKKLDPRITYARASTGVYYDGVTNSKAEENLFLYSQEFDNAYWAKNNGVITANTTTAPDGTTTADTLVCSSGSDWIRQNVTILAALRYTYSISVKENASTTFILTEAGATASSATFTLSGAGSVSVSDNGGSPTATITDVGSGWYRCTFSWTNNAGLSTLFIHNYSPSAFIWGAQVEQRSAVSSYQPTTTQPITKYQPTLLTASANVARFDHDPITNESLGLLIEEQRTNLVTYSEDFSNASWPKINATVTPNQWVAPDGTLTMDKLVENTATGQHLLRRTNNPVLTAGTTYSYSIYAQSSNRNLQLQLFRDSTVAASIFDLSSGTIASTTTGSATIQNVGNNVFRCTVTGVVSGGAVTGSIVDVSIIDETLNGTYTGDGYSGIYIWGAQLEAGAFPTSYIPTVASQVTRSADSASMTGANFSSWYRADASTMYAEFISNASTSTVASAFAISDGSISQMINTYVQSGIVQQIRNVSTQATLTPSGALSVGSLIKTVVSAYANDFAGSVNGLDAVVDTVGSMPIGVDRLQIGSNASLTVVNMLNGTIKKLSYFPARLSNEELQEMTS